MMDKAGKKLLFFPNIKENKIREDSKRTEKEKINNNVPL